MLASFEDVPDQVQVLMFLVRGFGRGQWIGLSHCGKNTPGRDVGRLDGSPEQTTIFEGRVLRVVYYIFITSVYPQMSCEGLPRAYMPPCGMDQLIRAIVDLHATSCRIVYFDCFPTLKHATFLYSIPSAAGSSRTNTYKTY